MSKYDDYHKVDNRYTTAIGMSSWRFFNIGKYKNQKVKDVCYFNPFYVAWCLENWQGFSLTSYERFNYMKGLERVCLSITHRRVGRQMTDSYHMSSKRRAHT